MNLLEAEVSKFMVVFDCLQGILLVDKLHRSITAMGFWPGWLIVVFSARVAKLADAQDLGSCTARCGGSTPPSRNWPQG